MMSFMRQDSQQDEASANREEGTGVSDQAGASQEDYLLPSNNVKSVKRNPLFITRAEGSKIYDVDGNEYIRIDKKQIAYIDYLKYYIEFNDIKKGNIFFGDLYKHKNMIEQNIEKYKDDSKIIKKYSWIAEYHNEIINEKFPDETNLRIDIQ